MESCFYAVFGYDVAMERPLKIRVCNVGPRRMLSGGWNRKGKAEESLPLDR